MIPRTLTPSERAVFRLTHDLDVRDGYAVDLIALTCGVPVREAQRFWDESPAGTAYSTLALCEQELERDTIQEHVDALASDPYLASIMRVCEHYLIPFSEFCGWPERDQNLALAYFLDSRDTCPGCGLAKRLRTTFLRLSSEQCIHCQQLNEARQSMPDEVRHHTHLTILPETS